MSSLVLSMRVICSKYSNHSATTLICEIDMKVKGHRAAFCMVVWPSGLKVYLCLLRPRASASCAPRRAAIWGVVMGSRGLYAREFAPPEISNCAPAELLFSAGSTAFCRERSAAVLWNNLPSEIKAILNTLKSPKIGYWLHDNAL